jgi:hypothetical protein
MYLKEILLYFSMVIFYDESSELRFWTCVPPISSTNRLLAVACFVF